MLALLMEHIAAVDPEPPSKSNCVIVTATSSTARSAAMALARALGLAYHDSPPTADALLLTQTERHLELRDAASRTRLHIQFNAAELRRYRAGGDPLRRAIGPGARHIADATAGFGRDAVHLAALGYRVTAIERNEVVSALAQDGIARARRQGILSEDNPGWSTGDARELLPRLHERAATIYLDPMFPPKRKKSAAARKEMQLLRRLGIDDADAVELLRVARRCAADRVVVKRPIDAPPLAADVMAAYRGNLVRYDVYRPRESPP